MELLSNKEKLHGIIANVELHGMNVKDELHGIIVKVKLPGMNVKVEYCMVN